MSKTVLFQVIQPSISTQFCSIWPIDRTLSVAITLGLSGPGGNGYEGVLCIPQSSSITGISPSDCLVSYPGHLFESGALPLCRGAVGVFYSPNWLGKTEKEWKVKISITCRGMVFEYRFLVQNKCENNSWWIYNIFYLPKKT